MNRHTVSKMFFSWSADTQCLLRDQAGPVLSATVSFPNLPFPSVRIIRLSCLYFACPPTAPDTEFNLPPSNEFHGADRTGRGIHDYGRSSGTQRQGPPDDPPEVFWSVGTHNFCLMSLFLIPLPHAWCTTARVGVLPVLAWRSLNSRDVNLFGGAESVLISWSCFSCNWAFGFCLIHSVWARS